MPTAPFSNDIIIRADNLSRVYRSYRKAEGFRGSLKGFFRREHVDKIALAPTSLQLRRGEIIGLVGSNGAGKTTLLKLLSGLIHPSSGTATVMGFSPWERDFSFLRRVSLLLGQKNQLWWDLSPEDSFRLLAEIYDLDRAEAKRRVRELAEVLKAEHVLSTQLRRLSLGERMKMEIIGALLHRPEVLFLDEPTIGLDIVAQTAIREFLADYTRRYRPTVILTSHYMDDIANLADRLLLISKGEIVYDGTVDAFTKRSEIENLVTFDLSEALSQDLEVIPQHKVSAGQLQHSFKIKPSELPLALSRISTLPGISKLRIEETDFEDVIHRFLAQE